MKLTFRGSETTVARIVTRPLDAAINAIGSVVAGACGVLIVPL